jgi:dienelactone hydrolase
MKITPSLRALAAIALAYYLTCNYAIADGPDDNHPSKVRLVPPKGLELAPEKREELRSGITAINSRVEAAANIKDIDRCQILGLTRAVQMTIDEEMFYSEAEIAHASKLLDLASARIDRCLDGQSGYDLVVADSIVKNGSRLIFGGFRSKIDRSIQPFGIVAPESWRPDPAHPVRLDVWLHGRDEKSGEVGFLLRRMSQPGEFTPANTLVLHPYGRYSNAFKFAGEIDVLEGIDHVSKLVAVDPNRISIRGFSMGGAGCWQMAIHYPDQWFAATPGAGFSETTEFLRIFQNEEFKPTWYQKQLLHWYDCPDWSNNVKHLNLIAYSGELDRQKQAADIMEAALKSRGIELKHVIGPATEHKFHSDSKNIITEQMDQWSKLGRDALPNQIDFTTYSLRYFKHHWVSIGRLDKHWHESRIRGSRSADRIELTTSNVRQLMVDLPAESLSLRNNTAHFVIDGQELSLSPVQSNDSTLLHFELSRPQNTWVAGDAWRSEKFRKGPMMQGPIDDAFMDSLVFVPATNPTPALPKQISVHAWLNTEFEHATKQWRRHFRGDIPLASADKIAAAVKQIESGENAADVLKKENLDANWILFGTPENNPAIAAIAKHLPIQWNNETIKVGKDSFPVEHAAVAMIYPNPINPKRYIVLNSGFTFREYAYLNNARQIPMLPDWAILDTQMPSNSQMLGKVLAAGFFDESWGVTETQPK